MNLESTDQTNSWWSSSVKHQTDCQCQQQHTITTTDGNTVKNISVYFRQTKISISHALTMLRTKLHTHTHTHVTGAVHGTQHKHDSDRTARCGAANKLTQNSTLCTHMSFSRQMSTMSLAVCLSNNSSSYSFRYSNATKTTVITISKTNTELNASTVPSHKRDNRKTKQPRFTDNLSFSPPSIFTETFWVTVSGNVHRRMPCQCSINRQHKKFYCRWWQQRC